MTPAATVSRLRLLAAAVLLFLWLLWSGGAGALALAQELTREPRVWSLAFTQSAEKRLEKTLLDKDEKLGLPRGYELGILRAVTEHVPAHATVEVLGLRDKKKARVLLTIPNLAFPRRVGHGLIPLPSEWTPDATSYLLAFDGEARALLEGKKEELATGPDWVLWH